MGVDILAEYINLTPENIDNEHLCCIIRTKTRHSGVEAKREWLRARLKEGHIFRKLNEKATVFIEYAPLETAWAPIVGDNYYYIYCLWVLGEHKGKGYGKELLSYCIADAQKNRKSGICMLGADKQKAWLTDTAFAKKFGFEAVDFTDSGYQLLALSFDKTVPQFKETAKSGKIESRDLTIFYDMQCPYIEKAVKSVEEYCSKNNIPLNLILIDSLEKAKSVPCPFNNYAVFYGGKFKTVNLLDIKGIERILK